MKTPARDRNVSVLHIDCVAIPPVKPTKSRWHNFDFPLQLQELRNWCWAALAASVEHFYRPSSHVTQCSIANGELRREDCCDSEGKLGGCCDVPGFLMSSLNRVGHFRKWTPLKDPTPDQVREETNSRRPLCTRIAWFGGGAHFVTIIGYVDERDPEPGGTSKIAGLAIADPDAGLFDVDYADFPVNYRTMGISTDTYYTKPRRFDND